MPQEIRVQAEGSLKWVQASGDQFAWQTASSPNSGLLGFVQAGFSFNDINREFVTVSDRGVAYYHKLTKPNMPIDFSFTVLYGITANYPVIGTASGRSVPEMHMEFRMDSPEGGVATYYQLLHCVEMTRTLTEQEEGNQYVFNMRAITAIGPTTNGYLSP